MRDADTRASTTTGLPASVGQRRRISLLLARGGPAGWRQLSAKERGVGEPFRRGHGVVGQKDAGWVLPLAAVAYSRAAKTITAGIETGKAEIVFPLQMAVLMKTARLVPIRLWSLLAQPRGDRAPS